MSHVRRARKVPFPRLLALAAACLGPMILGGCATGASGGSQVGHYTVRVQTPMFRYGPAQSFGPDFSLTQGQHVVMLSKEFGYSRVMTDDGQSGYVATEDLTPAPPPVPPPKQESNRSLFTRAGAARSGGRSGVSSANAQVMQSGPLFGEGELPPLPVKDPLEPTRPGFRVSVPSAAASSDSKPAPAERKPGFRVRVPSNDNR